MLSNVSYKLSRKKKQTESAKVILNNMEANTHMSQFKFEFKWIKN